VGSLSIGAFAKACGLTQKALRLYGELGLLTPARVDPFSGYRWYEPEQLERARLVAWLRRLGMPLARIREVCELPGPRAAREVAAFWERVEADTAARRDLAAFLVGHLSEEDTTMSRTGNPLHIRYAALSDAGAVRESNQDAAYAGSRLLAVADGFGERGAPASAAAIEALKPLETEEVPAGGLLDVLKDAVDRANRAVCGLAGDDPAAADAGTTLTAMLWNGSELALAHIGDSRAYLLRDGGLFRITRDHTLVQSMVDEGRITPEEAASHPQRALLLRALAHGTGNTPDLRLQDVRVGDRYLLCSDGLSAVADADRIHQVVAGAADPGTAVRELVALAYGSGGPDNVSCVVADVLEPAA
jgi:PPM family protein phosphatase